ncbi:MAG: DNA primase, partial [Pseudomonadota bacterium]
MTIPQSFLDELTDRVTLSSYAERKLTWDRRKSQPSKGDFWACCPFHQEKSASFHIDDRKGRYYCFGCHAGGNLIGFVREIENVGFREAVEILAQEAGMTMPDENPRQAAREERRKGLVEAMEAAVRFYCAQLRGAEGAVAYLKGRGLTGEVARHFEIGFAPDGRDTLARHLKGEGFDDDTIFAAGLASPSDRGPGLYDKFRDRITFPIRDGRGQAIAFGGRAMNPAAKAKYLNSPETAIFHKGRTLYNLREARAAAGKGETVIVAEGYMDVIALVTAGFNASVAPLGTAVTEDQLRLLWKMTDEPVMALDGDAAGQRAANRAAELALPLLEPGKTLRFAYMPDGQDPDDLLRAEGPEALRDVLMSSVSLIETLWRREVTAPPHNGQLDTPERKAAFDKRLRELAGSIRDASVRRHYLDDFKERRYHLFRTERQPPPGAPSTPNAFSRSPFGGAGPNGDRVPGRLPGRMQQGRWVPVEQGASASARASHLGRKQGGAFDEDLARPAEAVLLTAMLNHPGLIAEFEPDIEALSFYCTDLDEVRITLLSALAEVDPIADDQVPFAPPAVEQERTRARQVVDDAFGEGTAAALVHRSKSLLPKSVNTPAPFEIARAGFAEMLRHYASELTWLREGTEFAEDLAQDADEDRVKRLQETMRRTQSPELHGDQG